MFRAAKGYALNGRGVELYPQYPSFPTQLHFLLPSTVIKPLLSQFIDESSLDADLVEFGLNGELSLNDVKLNTTSSLVRGLELPLRISAAYVKRWGSCIVLTEINLRQAYYDLRLIVLPFPVRLKLKVSWANLLSAPIRVEVAGLYVVCSPDKEVLGSDRLQVG